MATYEEKLFYHQRMYDEYERQVIAIEIQRRARYNEAMSQQFGERSGQNDASRSRRSQYTPPTADRTIQVATYSPPEGSSRFRSKSVDVREVPRRRRDEGPLCSRTVGGHRQLRDTHFLDAEDGRPTPPLLLAASTDQSRYPTFVPTPSRSLSSRVRRGTILQKFVQNAEAKSTRLRERTKGLFEPHPHDGYKCPGYDSHTTMYTNGVRLTWDEDEGTLRDEQGKRWYLDAFGIVWCPPQE